MFSYDMINQPLRYKTPDLKEGESAVIHILQSKRSFVNLKFKDSDQTKDVPNLTIGDYSALSDKEVKAKIKILQNRILKLGSIYTCYSYLFVIVNKEPYLISMAMDSITLGFEMVCKIAQELQVPTPKPLWSGTFTQHAINAFYEDIFVQKK